MSASCPDPARWRQLLGGGLPGDEHTRLAAHLDTCPGCRHVLEELAGGDGPYAEAVRGLRLQEESVAPGLDRAMRELKRDAADAKTLTAPPPTENPFDFLDPPQKPGQLGRLGPYEVIELIGQGGMGIVFKAFDPALHRFVAVKVLAPQLAAAATARQRFAREARAAAAVSHEHFVAIHAVDEFKGLPYLVMEYIRGQSLQERLDRTGPLGTREVLRIGMQTAAGLAAAHKQGLVHRDVKPANILLENGVERVKLTDFGLARAVDDGRLTQTGVVAGTPQYVAPEQARGEALDHRADLFSLGAVLYTLCTGRPPFKAGSAVAVLYNVCQESPRPVREMNADVPDWLAEVVDRLLAKDPAQRFQSAAEVTDLLGNHLAHLQQPGAFRAPRRGRMAHTGDAGWGSWSRVVTVALPVIAGIVVVVAVLGKRILLEKPAPATAEGRLVVDSRADPQVAVLLDGRPIGLNAEGLAELSLADGRHRVQALKRGKTLYQKTVEVPPGPSRITITITAETVTGKPEPEQGGAGANLVLNPGFEDAADVEGRQPAYWIAMAKTIASEPEARCYRDTATRLKGQASAAIAKLGTKNPQAEAGFLQNVLRFPEGERVFLSGYVKAQDLKGAAFVRLQLTDPNGAVISSCSTPEVQGTKDRERYQASLLVPAGATGQVVLVLRGSGTAWFDELQLQVAAGSKFVPLQANPLVGTPRGARPRTHLLKNGGFEEEIGNIPTDWLAGDVDLMKKTGPTFFADREVKHSGKRSATIIAQKARAEPYVWSQDVADYIPTGKVVRLSGWVKTRDADLAAVAVQLQDANTQFIAFHTTQHKQEFRGTADWKPFTLRFPVPPGTARIGVLAMLRGPGQVWFDDFDLQVEEDPNK